MIIDGELLALTLWRPWPHSLHGAVVRHGSDLRLLPGPKPVENRRNTHPPSRLVGKGFLALISGATWDMSAAPFLRERGWLYDGPSPKFHVTGVAFLERGFGRCERGCRHCAEPALDPLSQSPFYMGRVGWVLSGRVPLIDPVPCKGSQGVRALPPDVERRVRDEYARSVRELGNQLPDEPRMAVRP